MTTSDTETGPDGIRVVRRSLKRLTPNTPVYVYYQSNRGNKKRKEASGVVTSVTPLASDKRKFQFYDDDAKRLYEVTVRGTIGECKVRSKKTETWSTVGSPVLVLADPDTKSADTLHQEYVIGKRNDEFDAVVAAARIKENKKALYWLEQHS